MKKMRLFLLVFAAAALSFVSGCKKDYTGKEKTHPVFIKAGTAQNSGDYAAAAKLYEEFLAVAPKSAETHMKLAALYGDNLDSPLKAVYHYQKVIELRPDDTANNENIQSFITQSKKRLFEKMKEDFRDEAADKALKEELEQTKATLEKYKEYSKKLRDAFVKRDAMWRERMAQMQKTGRAVSVPSGRKSTVPPASSVKPNTVTAATAGTAASASVAGHSDKILGTHVVQKGESLRSISKKYYGSPRYYKLIAEANKGSIPANLSVRIGQPLRLPQLPKK